MTSRAALLLLVLGTAAPAAAQDLAAQRGPVCLACHGAQGASEQPGIPSLGAQPPDYLLVQLLMFREKQRKADPMNAMAEGLTDDDLQTLAATMSALPAPPPAAEPPDAALAAQGQTLVAQYRCASCHGATLAGHDQIPRIAGQREDYLLKTLTEYKSNARPGYEPAMNEVAQAVKADDIPILARYLARYR